MNEAQAQWGGWENLGGTILEQPECVSWGPNRIDCFARGTNRAMYHRWWNGSSWGGWENLGGTILEQPECVSWGSGRINCFARGTNAAMYHRWWPAGTTRLLTISRHNTVTLTNAVADSILADFSTVLQTNDGSGDVGCAVTFSRSGNVGVFSTGDGSLDTNAELSAVFNLPGNVKVVDDVNFCGGQFNTSFVGCGQTPGTSFITERFTANQEGILWAHEFGHNQGLQHRDTSTNNVMYWTIGTNRRRVNQTECNAFRGQGALVAMAGEKMPGETAGEPMPEAPVSGEAMPSGEIPVEEFVSQIYFHGLPLDQAAAYGDDSVDTLLAMLSDPDRLRYHENVALTLGMIGSERAVEPLIAYIQQGAGSAALESWQGTEEEASRAAFKGRVGAVMALGYIVNRSGSEKALGFLKDSTSPQAWQDRGTVGLTAETKRRDLSKYAIISLGLSGNQEAAQHLKALRDQMVSGAEAAFRESVGDVIDQSLQLNEQVRRDGLLNYYKSE